MNTAFARIEAAQSAAESGCRRRTGFAFEQGARGNAFSGARRYALATDALAAFCTQLTIGQIDVANAEGTLIASSDAARIGLNLGAEAGFDWVMGAVEDPTAELLQTAENDRSILYCCLPRADIEGFVLLTSDDTIVDNALALSSVDALIADLPTAAICSFRQSRRRGRVLYRLRQPVPEKDRG